MFQTARVLLIGPLLAGALVQAQGIYSCVDSKGRRLSADRPIAECADRQQKLLSPGGTVKATVGPTLTAQERAELEARHKREAEERARQAEEKRRERALLLRYPNKIAHDKERAEAVARIGAARAVAMKRGDELRRQRDKLETELEFYNKEPAKVPLSLRQQADDNAHSLALQGRLIADQEAEIVRLNAHFDQELVRLKQLWARQSPRSATASRR